MTGPEEQYTEIVNSDSSEDDDGDITQIEAVNITLNVENEPDTTGIENTNPPITIIQEECDGDELSTAGNHEQLASRSFTNTDSLSIANDHNESGPQHAASSSEVLGRGRFTDYHSYKAEDERGTTEYITTFNPLASLSDKLIYVIACV